MRIHLEPQWLPLDSLFLQLGCHGHGLDLAELTTNSLDSLLSLVLLWLGYDGLGLAEPTASPLSLLGLVVMPLDPPAVDCRGQLEVLVEEDICSSFFPFGLVVPFELRWLLNV